MRTPLSSHRILDLILSTDPKRRIFVGMALLALALMICSVGVLLMVVVQSNSHYYLAAKCWGALAIGGLGVMTVLIRCGFTARLSDPALTVPQIIWTVTSGAGAYVLAGDARGLVPSVLANILFFGTFSFTMAQVIWTGTYTLLAFACAVAITALLNNTPFGYMDTAYALTVLIVLSGSVALNVRVQRIRALLREQRNALAEALAINRELATRDDLTGLPNRRALSDLMELESRRSQRSGRPMLLAQLDIDHFKRVNDTWIRDLMVKIFLILH